MEQVLGEHTQFVQPSDGEFGCTEGLSVGSEQRRSKRQIHTPIIHVF